MQALPGRLSIRGSRGQRVAHADVLRAWTPRRTWSMCMPQPLQEGLLHVEHVTFLHILSSWAFEVGRD